MSDATHPIELSGLTHRYGSVTALEGLDLHVASGEVLGLLGHNGAGKSTTVKALLGLLKPDAGSCRVLGLDPWRSGPEVRRRVGYVPERLTIYEWITVAEILRFVSAFHPTWDEDLERDVVRRLELPLEQRVGTLSRGTLAKVHLACAVCFRPEALILDDPTSGLDALVRREVLEQVIDLAADGGRAVLFSSHVLDEVERLADRVAIVVSGRKVLDRPLDDLKRDVQRVTMTAGDATPERLADVVEGVLDERRDGQRVEAVIDHWSEAKREALERGGVTSIAAESLALEDAFVEVVRSHRDAAASEAGAR